MAVGAVILPDHGDGAAKLLQRADVALSAAKRSRRRAVVVYEPSRDLGSLRRLALASSLREAIDTGQITVAYQPKMSVRGGIVTGAEALARWQHPVHGTIAPDEFIDLAERTGLIVDLTIGVMRESLRRQQAWRRQGIDLSMAVNLSTRALLDREFPGRILELLEEEAGASDRLTVEVTESVMMAEPDRMIASLDHLAATGITISIDDFGTGYSSLAYLHRLPASEVKIDKSLASPLTRSTDAVTIVTAIIRLAHSLRLTVVAEGIEDQQTWDMLADLGCDVAQGYHVAHPLPPEEFEHWLAGARSAQAPAGDGPPIYIDLTAEDGPRIDDDAELHRVEVAARRRRGP
jgi:EAL domain-containing protein (putative c-di-GMP-specific phosphodiesterase class I)